MERTKTVALFQSSFFEISGKHRNDLDEVQMKKEEKVEDLRKQLGKFLM